MIEINGEKKHLSELTIEEWGLVIFGVLFSLIVVVGVFLMLLPIFAAIGGFLLIGGILLLVAVVSAGIGSGIRYLFNKLSS